MKTFFLSKPMLEEIALPRNSDRFRRPFFPLAYNRLEAFLGLREGDEKMHMIRHEQREMDIPNHLVITMLDCREQRFCHIWKRQLVSSPRFAGNRDEVRFLRRVNPQQNVMRKLFSDR